MDNEAIKTLAAAVLKQVEIDYHHGITGKYTSNYPNKYCNPKYLIRWLKSPYASTLFDLAGIDKDYFMERILKHA